MAMADVYSRSLRCATLLSLLSLSIFTAHDILRPLFGSTATQSLIRIVVSSAFLLSFLSKYGQNASNSLLAGAFSIFPLALHLTATWTTQAGDRSAAASLSILTLLPIVLLTSSSLKLLLPTWQSRTAQTLVGAAFASAILALQHVWTLLPFSNAFNPSLLLVLSSWLLFGSEIPPPSKQNRPPSARRRTKSRVKKFIIPCICTAVSFTVPPTRSRSLPYVHSNGLLRILSSVPSVTGRIVVGEELQHGLRYLRADHSLLGGVWIGQQRIRRMNSDFEVPRDAKGTPLGDSIYSAFVLQEAARLQKRTEPAQTALMIGLGTGIAAQAFMQHGLATTVIEIDPAVYAAAREYFGVPQPAAVYLEDARGWVARRSASRNETYDIIVHDCFSGGGVPEHLFTTEFWEDLKKIMSPQSIVAVNYAGHIDSDSTRAIYGTLKQSFGQCRVFRDYYEQDLSEEKLMSMFINLVFFCMPSTSPLEFRRSTAPDYLGSYLREHVLSTLPLREVPERLVFASTQESSILTDAHNPLGKWQDAGASEHWKVMRQVLPDFVWFTY